MASKFVTWMPSAREYGVVSELPKELYQEMPRVKGRFMAYTGAGWHFIQGRRVPDRQLERLAARRSSGRWRQWQLDNDQSGQGDGQSDGQQALEWAGSDN
ncbi:hypothetical protein V6O07_20525, partial [Arthrospira platensis SPKY2]